MRYIMVPVPSEHVFDVMRWVLFRSPDEAKSVVLDQARMKTIIGQADERTRSLLLIVATAAIEDTTVDLTDAADATGLSPDTARVVLRDLNVMARGVAQTMVMVSNETDIGGAASVLSMQPRHAQLVLDTLGAIDAPSQQLDGHE